MIAAVTYTFTGAEGVGSATVAEVERVEGPTGEIRVDGAGEDRVTGEGAISLLAMDSPLVYVHAMGGHRCLDVIFKGVSLQIGVECLVNESNGAVQVLQPAERGDDLLVLFTTIPWFNSGTGGPPGSMTEYEELEYEFDDYE